MASEQMFSNIPPVKSAGLKKWLIVAIVILVLILIGCGAFYFFVERKKEQSAQTKEPAQVISQSKKTEETKDIVDPGVNWLPEPEELGNLGLFNAEYNDGSQYYKIADLTNGGQLIYAYASADGVTMSGYRFEKNPSGAYILLVNNSSTYPDDFLNKEKRERNLIAIDYNTTYISLVAPQILIFNKVSFIKDDLFFPEGDLELAFEKNNQEERSSIGHTPYGELFEVQHAAAKTPNLKGISYLLKLPDTSVVTYTIKKDFLAADGAIVATFNGNYNELSRRKFDSVLCADIVSGDKVFADEFLSNRLLVVGTTPSGANLYIPRDNNDEILKAAYESYKLEREENNILNYETFVGQNPVLIWKDPLGNYIIFVSEEYQSPWDCKRQI